MAKKTKKEQLNKPKTFSKEELEAALQILHSEYFMQTIGVLSHDPDQRDLTYVKVPVTTPDGGNYLICILHVDGPKIQLDQLAKAAETQQFE